MSTPPKAKGRKPETAAAHAGRSKTDSMGDELLRDAIYRAVRGEPSPWPIDPEFSAKGTFEDRFMATTKYSWAIDDSAQKRRPLPEWVTQERTKS
jgi:hypothetical protein